MKLKLMVFLSVTMVTTLTLSGCGNKVLDFRNAEISNGKVYKAGSNDPFSGTLTNVPNNAVLSHQEGFTKVSAVIANVIFTADENGAINNLAGAAGLAAAVSSGSVCDVKISDGRLDGKAICKKPNSESRVLELDFDEGNLSGKLVYYGPQGGDDVISTVMFKAGEPTGKQEIFSLANKKLVYETFWNNGVREGDETAYDAQTSNIIGHATYRNGKLEGELVRYAADGKQLVYKVMVAAGQKDGVEEIYDRATGKLVSRGNWTGGQKDGLFQTWDAQGQLTAEVLWANGVAKEDHPIPLVSQEASPGLDDCTQSWISAHRREAGEDAVVTADQVGEWEGWCKEGKRPS